MSQEPTPQQGEAARVSLAGPVMRVFHHKPETGFCILQVLDRAQDQPVKVLGPLAAATIQPGDEIECSGTLETDKSFGPQFRSELILTTPPRTEEGIERYLASGAVTGIGPALAKRLIQAFGADVIEVIDKTPERLLEVPGLGPTRVQRLQEAWVEQRAVHEIMLFLRSHGLGEALAFKVHKAYGMSAIAKIQDDPYQLARDIQGIGFQLADQIASRIGVPFDSPKRARAGVIYVMQARTVEGHCADTRTGLSVAAGKLLGHPDPGIIERAIDECLTSGDLVFDEDMGWVYLKHLHVAEVWVARHINRLLEGRLPWKGVDGEWAVRWAESHTGLTMAESQREAIRKAVASKVMVLTGGPGTGKTTILNGILGIVAAQDAALGLCAPTGRAAKRLSESTGKDAFTIHRLLEYNPQEGGFKRDAENPLDVDLVVVDEASMVDIHLMNSLLMAIPDGAALLIVGDQDQLPSVGAGAVLGDLIRSGVIPVVRLTEIHRQGMDSLIVRNAHRINHGVMPQGAVDGVEPADFFVIRSASPETIRENLLEVVTQRIPARFGLDPKRDIQVLAPMKKGAVGTRTLNEVLRAALNEPDKPKLARFGQEFSEGDKVLQTVNNYKKDVFNGDIGVVASVNLEDGVLTVDFDGRLVEYTAKELDNLLLAYATTIHKSQGSEYPAVVIPVSTEQHVMLERSLLYTAVTRGRKVVVLLCQEAALSRAVSTVKARVRMTGLAKRLQDEKGGGSV